MSNIALNRFSIRRGLREDDVAMADQYLLEALSRNKREGLLLAVRARWVALAVIAVFIPYLNFSWDALYYEVLLIAFVLIGWAQLPAGQVVQSRRELLLIFCDLTLMTFALAVPIHSLTAIGRRRFNTVWVNSAISMFCWRPPPWPIPGAPCLPSEAGPPSYGCSP